MGPLAPRQIEGLPGGGGCSCHDEMSAPPPVWLEVAASSRVPVCRARAFFAAMSARAPLTRISVSEPLGPGHFLRKTGVWHRTTFHQLRGIVEHNRGRSPAGRAEIGCPAVRNASSASAGRADGRVAEPSFRSTCIPYLRTGEPDFTPDGIAATKFRRVTLYGRVPNPDAPDVGMH